MNRYSFSFQKTEQTAPPTPVVTPAPVDPFASFLGYKVHPQVNYWVQIIGKIQKY
jgi:hypothetical protein